MSPSRRVLALTTLLAPLFLIGAGCNAPDTDVSANQPPQAVVPATPPAGGGMGMQPQTPPELTDTQTAELQAGEATHTPGELTFHVTGGSFYFTPNMIKVKKGDKVTIVFENAGGMHNFLLDEFNVTMNPIKTGESQTVTFTADKVGTFEYYCGVGQHRKMGQKGQLVITE